MKQGQNSKKLLNSISCKRKLIKVKKKNIQKLEEKVATLGIQQDYSFDILLKYWMLSPFSDSHKDMTAFILLGSLIPPLTAEVERYFSLMNLICTWLRKTSNERPKSLHEDLQIKGLDSRWVRTNFEIMVKGWWNQK